MTEASGKSYAAIYASAPWHAKSRAPTGPAGCRRVIVPRLLDDPGIAYNVEAFHEGGERS